MIKFTIITLFREAIEPYLKTSMMWKATEKGLAEFDFVNLRDFGLGPHKSVDDTVYGGGDGMLLRCEPVFAAVESVKATDPEAKVILPTPVGEIWNQQLAQWMAGVLSESHFSGPASPSSTIKSSVGRRLDTESKLSVCSAPTAVESYTGQPAEPSLRDEPVGDVRNIRLSRSNRKLSRENDISATPATHYIILCPHYEGYDERILSIVDYKISLGKYVLTGGELPALIIIDSIVRLIPGVLGGETSAEIESFSDGDNLEYPQYTRPEDFRGMKVPEVLLSGNHAEIAKWREAHSKREAA
ncbi:tRNA (guanine(37)-N(1))-methyltransferase [Candidatus Saccharibacteria bacterium]|nr:tRNA (guanine(37)-N(1))-methyltransferase [Candidatus Saccharibacteria bacterium]